MPSFRSPIESVCCVGRMQIQPGNNNGCQQTVSGYNNATKTQHTAIQKAASANNVRAAAIVMNDCQLTQNSMFCAVRGHIASFCSSARLSLPTQRTSSHNRIPSTDAKPAILRSWHCFFFRLLFCLSCVFFGQSVLLFNAAFRSTAAHA